MKMNQKGFVNIVLIVLVVVLAGAVGYFVLTGKQEPVSQTVTLSVETPTPTPLITEEQQLKVVSPGGGEFFNITSSISIKWNLIQESIARFTKDHQIFISLIKEDGSVFGIIGDRMGGHSIKSGMSEYQWSPDKIPTWYLGGGGKQTLYVWRGAGLDDVVVPVEPGRYRILVSVATAITPHPPSLNVRFSDGKVLYDVSVCEDPREEKNCTKWTIKTNTFEFVLSDTSDPSFTIR